MSVSFIVLIFLGSIVISFIYQLFEWYYEDKYEQSRLSYEFLFYNTPDKNSENEKTIRRQSLFRSLLKNVAIVSLVLLVWLLNL